MGGRVTIRTRFWDELGNVEEELRFAAQNSRTARSRELPRGDIREVLASLRGHLLAAQAQVDRAETYLGHPDWVHSAKTVGAQASISLEPLDGP
ncbi:MAG TPA: hypothetical protein VMG99_09135 [Thermoplasmata archaeon]|nr:hypothetical protein [Thermoplasmata archaeon]